MNKTEAIKEFKRAAETGFTVLGPAKTVARAMALIGCLRTKHGRDWRETTELFNAAMRDLGSSEISATTLCRLYNLERKRIERRKLKIGNATKASTPDAAAPVPTVSAAPTLPAPISQVLGHPNVSGSRARDGPLPVRLEDPNSLDTSDLPSTSDIRAQAREMAAFKNQAKRKT